MSEFVKTRTRIERTIFIKNVYPEDCHSIEEEYENKLVEEQGLVSRKITYDKLPEVFKNVEKWPKHTNLSCWRCSLTINSMPWFIPSSMEPNPSMESKFIIPPIGVFCSPIHAYEYICIYTDNLASRDNFVRMLKLLYEHIVGSEITEFTKGPDPMTLEKFGGNTPEHVYRKKIKEIRYTF